jgi:hypothetical protein
MQCQKCQDKIATVHLHGKRATQAKSGQELSSEVFEFHFCEGCARRSEFSKSLYPQEHAGQIIERVRVLRVAPNLTVLRLIRTDADAKPEDLSPPMSPLPDWAVGSEMTMSCTRSQLERMREGLLPGNP